MRQIYQPTNNRLTCQGRRQGKAITMDCLLAYALAISVGWVVWADTVVAQELNQLFVQVVNRTGEAVTDLSRSDFIIREDGIACEIVSAELATEPMKIALLVENSDEITAAGSLISLRDGLDGFLTTLPEQHEVAFGTIAENIQWRVDFTFDREELKKSANELFVVGGSGPILLDGIKETLERRFELPEAWPVFVVVATDGSEASGNMNENQYTKLVNDLVSNGATVHIILLSTRGGGFVTELAISLTQHTGGLYEVFGAGTRLATALPQLAMKLGRHHGQVSQRYRVIYERPDPPGARMSIEVARYLSVDGVSARGFVDRGIKE